MEVLKCQYNLGGIKPCMRFTVKEHRKEGSESVSVLNGVFTLALFGLL